MRGLRRIVTEILLHEIKSLLSTEIDQNTLKKNIDEHILWR